MLERKQIADSQKEAKRQELEQMRLDAANAGKTGATATMDNLDKDGASRFAGRSESSIDAELPQVRLWKQNSDGSITGFIYNSKDFKDGTRVTSLPLQGGSTSGTVVRSGSGSQYILE